MAAVLNIKKEVIEKLPKFERSINWFKRYRKNTLKYPVIQSFVDGEDLLLSLVPQDRLLILMKSFLDEKEFLSDYGIRSLSKAHEKPYHISIENIDYSINYDEKRFNALKKTIDKFGTNKKKNIGHKSARPIFIVGMPRSGTTLIEQIVSSHSKVFGGGELLLFTDVFQKELNLKK